jgi:ketosteroid isomerase-like protein
VARAVSRSIGGPTRGSRRARDARDRVRGGDPAPSAAAAGDADPARCRWLLGARDGEAARHERAGRQQPAAAGARSAARERLPSRRDEWARSAPTAEQREVARRYVEAIERRDFAALAALVREDARFSFPPYPLWYDGLDAFRRGSEKHAAPGQHRFVAARANLQPTVAIYLRSPGEAHYRPLALSVLRVEGGRVVEVVDWSRPELFEAFGLPMSLPPSDRFNEDKVNAKEVR